MGLMSTIKKISSSINAQPGPELGRNEPCWCGSGKKYKQCHLSSDERKRQLSRAATRSGSAGGRGF